MKAQLHRKAGFATHHYTAKRMICFLPLAFRLETVKPLSGLLAVKSVNVNFGFYAVAILVGEPQMATYFKLRFFKINIRHDSHENT